MKKTLLLLTLIITLAAACSKDNGEKSGGSGPFKEGQELVIKGSFTTAATKAVGTAHEDSSVDFLWKSGDVITVTVGTASAEFTLADGSGKAEGSFKGIMPADGESFKVTYGGGRVPADQSFVLGGLDGSLVSASGEGTLANGFKLAVSNAIARFDLWGSNKEISSVSVKTSNGSFYKITIPNGIALGASQYDVTPFFLVLEPGTYSLDITVNDLDGSEICTLEGKESYNFEAGKVVNAGVLEVVNLADVHVAVDLGVSVKWATTNVGAATPEQFGDYYAWGEVSPYYETLVPEPIWKTGHETGYEISGYCGAAKFTEWETPPFGETDSDGYKHLKAENDCATVLWGPEWRMPTVQELDELLEKCTWEYVTVNVASSNLPSFIPKAEGFLVFKGKGDALDTSAYIFLPAAGNMKGLVLVDETPLQVRFWTATVYVTATNKGAHAFMLANKVTSTPARDYRSRFFGEPVRPVCVK